MSASMWPWAEAHGNVAYAYVICGAAHASMWPWAEAHGNRHRRCYRLRYLPLQCGRGPKPTEILSVYFSLSTLCSFNVAVGRSPRKLPERLRTEHELGASMWPWAEAHGNVSGSYVGLAAQSASMWPWAEAHGNSIRGPRYMPGPRLQCGRGPKPTEMHKALHDIIIKLLLQCGRGPKPTEIPYMVCCF